MAARGRTRPVRARRRSVLPADMVDEYLTFDCKTLSKIEKRMNRASADGYKLVKGIKRYQTPETGKYYSTVRFWAVMTKRVDPQLLAAAENGTTQPEPATSSGADIGPPNGGAAPAQIVHRSEIRRG